MNYGKGSVARVLFPAFLAILFSVDGQGQDSTDHSGHHGHQMTVTPDGVVMNENTDDLPRDCSEISRDYSFTIHAGRKYASETPGMIFGMSRHELKVEPCSRLEITFVNEDQVRHQWMVHGLPAYLYPAGMFHIEVSGGQSRTGTFIVPGDDRTYLVHCDMAQHMEKGMRGQVIVGRGSGDLWNVAGISDEFYRGAYLPPAAGLIVLLVLGLSFALAFWLLARRSKDPAGRRKGYVGSE